MLVAFRILVGSSFQCLAALTEKEQSPNVARERSIVGCKDNLVEDLRSYLDTVLNWISSVS